MTSRLAERVKWRLLLSSTVVVCCAISVGVDGGPIFQILAVENLALDPRAIGIALGLGTLSIPVQIWAARIPLERARHNLRIFLLMIGAMTIATGALVGWAPPGSWVAGLALVIAIAAEIAVSVLFATSWQPLIGYTMSVTQRQFLLGRGQAAKGVAVLVAVALFGELGQDGRALMLVLLGVAAFAAAASLHVLPPPGHTRGPVDTRVADVAAQATTDRSSVDAPGIHRRMIDIYLVLMVTAVAGFPLVITYAALVLWPTGNLGLLGAAASAGAIAASALWTDFGPRLISVVRSGALATAMVSIGLVALGGPIEGTGPAAAFLILAALGGAAMTFFRTGVFEMAHRRIDETNSVRIMTIIDVIGSTTAQLGMFVVGFLIAASEDSSAAVDPYEWWLIGSAALAVLAAIGLRRVSDV